MCKICRCSKSLKNNKNSFKSQIPETLAWLDDENLTLNQHLIELDELLSDCGPYEIDIRELTITQIQEHFQMGRLTSVELTQCYLNRISEMDVYLRSVIEVNPEAILLAERADMERSLGYVLCYEMDPTYCHIFFLD